MTDESQSPQPASGTGGPTSAPHWPAVLEALPVGVAELDAAGRIIACNRRFATLHGDPPGLPGCPWSDLADPADTERLRERLAGNPEARGVAYRARAGAITVQVLPLPTGAGPGWLLAEAPVGEDDLLRRMLRDAPDAIYLRDRTCFTYANPAAVRLFGVATSEALIGQPVLDFFHADFHAVVRERMRSVNEERRPVPPLEEKLIRADGQLLDVEVAATPIEQGGGPGALVFIRDISARKRAEEERRQLEARVQQARKLESLGILAGGVAHDFNNLLTAVIGHATLAQQDLPADAEGVRRHLAWVIEAAERAADLSRQMLAYSGRSQLVVRSVDLSQLVRETAALLAPSLSPRARIVDRLAGDLPPVQADANQLRQALGKLLLNASEALGDEPGTLTLTTGRTAWAARAVPDAVPADELPAGEYAFVEVADSGCGMDEATRQRVCDPFFSTKFTGRGLGLATVLGIVRGHGGAVEVRSAPGQGSAFRIWLPLRIAVPAAAAVPAGRLAPVTVLVVDDEPAVRELAGQALRGAGLRVLTAADPHEAVEILRQHGRSVGLVLLDLAQPAPPGAVRELRELRPDLPVILTSHPDEPEAVAESVVGAPTSFLPKPYRPRELLAKVRELLGSPG